MTAAVLVEISLERLVRAHQREVLRYLRFLGASDAEAQDLTQETYVEVWRKPFEERDPRATSAYLRQVAKHRFLMFLRARGREPALADLEGDWVGLAGDDGGDRRVDALRGCMETLDEKPRLAIDLVYRDGDPREEVAARLDLQPEGLKTLLRRGKAKLRACVERRLREEPAP